MVWAFAITQIWEGTNQIHRQLIGRSLNDALARLPTGLEAARGSRRHEQSWTDRADVM
ncbi:MAG: hypothetical protein ACM3JG_03380 [Thiohalocapsa sp.]